LKRFAAGGDAPAEGRCWREERMSSNRRSAYR
jgi:hypothetical protein